MEWPPSKAKCDDPINVIKQVIPNVKDNDYHDTENIYVPIIVRPMQGLSVDQLFTLMIGTLPSDHICHRKPTSVTYNSAFVVDLSCVRCIDDLRADNNGVWMHGGKPRRKYCVQRDPDTGMVITAEPLEGEPSSDSENFTLVRLFCTNPGAACVMGIAPTFNVGKFYVKVTTFTYSHVINKTTSKSPTFFGPMFREL